MIQKLKIILYVLFGFMLFLMIGNIVFNFSDVVLENDIFRTQNGLFQSHREFFRVPVSEKIIAIVSIIGMLSFCIGVFFLVKVLQTRKLSNYFSERIIGHLKISGLYIVFSGSINFFIAIVSPFFLAQKMIYPEQKISISLAILSIIIGVFFMLLSKVLVKAQGLKLENDLTI